MKTIYFDMDGTITDLYGVENWLLALDNFDPTPYQTAKPLINVQELSNILLSLQIKGYKISIISWLSKISNETYDREVTIAKVEWLKKNINIEFDEIHIVKYGTSKDIFRKSNQDILFDDEKKNRICWGGLAYDEKNILDILKSI